MGVLIADSVRPGHAPVPTNDAERLVFHQLYPGLLTVDCLGRLQPGVARAWSSTDGGLTWRVAIPPTARFADGTRLQAADVVASWRAFMLGSTVPDAGIVSVNVQDSLALRIRFDTAVAAPAVLAEARFAPLRRLGERWPVGAGALRIASESADRLEAASFDPTTPPVTFNRFAGDPRDALDRAGSADLLVTSDAKTIEYAAGRRDLEAVPLPWDRSYVLVAEETPGGHRGELRIDRAIGRSLARDAVRIDARPAGSDCAGNGTVSTTMLRPGTLYYRSDDQVAADLAARLAALAPSGGLVASGVEAAAFADSLTNGGGAGYVVPTERDGAGCIRAPVRTGSVVLPLIDTRSHAILRRGRATVRLDASGPVIVSRGAGGGEPTTQ